MEAGDQSVDRITSERAERAATLEKVNLSI